MRLWIGIACLALLLVLWVAPRQVAAQSTAQLESRLSRLESDVYQVRSDLSRLQSQLYNLNRPAGSAPTPSQPSPRYEPNFPRSNPPQSAIVDRLATLFVELKERVNALEARVTRLEKSGTR